MENLERLSQAVEVINSYLKDQFEIEKLQEVYRSVEKVTTDILISCDIAYLSAINDNILSSTSLQLKNIKLPSIEQKKPNSGHLLSTSRNYIPESHYHPVFRETIPFDVVKEYKDGSIRIKKSSQ